MPYLVLSDGTVFKGESFGAWPESGMQMGEVVFNTSMSGYQEMITDLSYSGQILVLTHPQIGNYGWHDEENEADKNLLKGLVIRELSDGEGSAHSDRTLDFFCKKKGIWGLKGVDTRALTRHIRQHGTLPGVFVQEAEDGIRYMEKGSLPETDHDGSHHWVYKTTVQEGYEISGEGPLLAVMDFGAKRNILRELQKRGFRLMIFPAWTSAEEILEHHPAGVVLSNGPGDPGELPELVGTVRELYTKVPTLGICLGHQLLAIAAGGKTYKLPFGHRGGNHPVLNIRTGKATMTAQNHGYAVLEDSLEYSGFKVHLKNLNDGTVEGMEHETYPAFSVQYHPEGAPGPEENAEIFEHFLAKLR